jgi:predicted nucleic acid-binding protein
MERQACGWHGLPAEGSRGMVKALFDTNVLIDYLNGVALAKEELERYTYKAISAITWMEVMVGATPETEAIMRKFLNDFEQLPIDAAVSERVVKLRRQFKIKLPDAIIWATAQCNNCILVTRNTKDFSHNVPDVHVPYSLV